MLFVAGSVSKTSITLASYSEYLESICCACWLLAVLENMHLAYIGYWECLESMHYACNQCGCFQLECVDQTSVWNAYGLWLPIIRILFKNYYRLY